MRNRKQTMKTLWMKVTGASTPSYSRFNEDDKENVCNDQQHFDPKEVDDIIEKPKKKKEIPNDSELDDEDNTSSKKKKKRKGWKRFRHAAMVTCRYIGIGVSHMSPISTYPPADYNLDPYGWCTSMNTGYGKTQPAHWTTGIILNGW